MRRAIVESYARSRAPGLRARARQATLQPGACEMSWASCIASPDRRRHADADRRQRARSFRLELDRARCDGGDTVSGDVVGLADSASVAILRLERRRDRYREFTVAETQISPPGGAFRLTLPQVALPSTNGKQCALRYVVCARTVAGAAYADLVVVASARPHLDAGLWRADRLLANWDARHFHIELADARLEGSGWLAGRVHRHRRWATGAIVVTARCLECWRCHAVASRAAPQWQAVPLWEHAVPLRVDADATWAPFRFAFPDGLPSAVEASTIAWRYELLAQRDVPHWLNETAAITPLLHEQAPFAEPAIRT
jgi:hypothetical protein